MSTKNENLWKVCFTYNPYKQLWFACLSEHLQDLWNGVNNPNILHAKDKQDLIDYFNNGRHLIDLPKSTLVDDVEFDSRS
tara:strand:- start:335 stop:574 length:240 start_codon:yes stop_codon:yes gene_type:complete